MKIKITEDEITDVLFHLKYQIHPNAIKLAELTRIIFGTSTDIQQRKVRKCIQELRNRGYLIIGERGYSLAGDDPEPIIHFVNGMYSRAYNITKCADTIYHEIKQRYGDAAKKVQALPEQPMLDMEKQLITKCINDIQSRANSEPAFRKSYTREGIENQFQADA